MKNNWELYEKHPQFIVAVAAIENAWEEAKRLAPELSTEKRAELAERFMYKVLNQWSKVGAADTEPMWELRHRVRLHFGVNGGFL